MLVQVKPCKHDVRMVDENLCRRMCNLFQNTLQVAPMKRAQSCWNRSKTKERKRTLRPSIRVEGAQAVRTARCPQASHFGRGGTPQPPLLTAHSLMSVQLGLA